jgi:hypothetical protein
MHLRSLCARGYARGDRVRIRPQRRESPRLPVLYPIIVVVLAGIIMLGFVLFERRHAREIVHDRSRAEPQPGRDSTAARHRR